MSQDVDVPRALAGVGGWLDDRFRAARGLRVLLRKVFPDHWSFMLGEIALWTFVVLLLTGTFLTLFFVPAMTEVVYHGSYAKLQRRPDEQAYASTLDISFDVRGGLLMRQIHHWAAGCSSPRSSIHLLRVFFTGAFRKPREINWLIGVVLLTLGLLEGFPATRCPTTCCPARACGCRRHPAGHPGGRHVPGVLPVRWPVPRRRHHPAALHIHVLLIPGLILALITAHLS